MKLLTLVIMLFISIKSSAQKSIVTAKDTTYNVSSLPYNDRAVLEEIYDEIISFERYAIKQKQSYAESETTDSLSHISLKEEIEENMQIFIRKLKMLAKNEHITFDKNERYGYVIIKSRNKNNTEHVVRLCLDKINEISNQ